MTKSATVAAFAVLVAVSVVVQAGPVCRYPVNGYRYDITPLQAYPQKVQWNNFGQTIVVTYHPCEPIACGSATDSAMCIYYGAQPGSSLGDFSSGYWFGSGLGDDKGFRMRFTTASAPQITTTINFTCDPSISVGALRQRPDWNNQLRYNYEFEWRTSFACPVAAYRSASPSPTPSHTPSPSPSFVPSPSALPPVKLCCLYSAQADPNTSKTLCAVNKCPTIAGYTFASQWEVDSCSNCRF